MYEIMWMKCVVILQFEENNERNNGMLFNERNNVWKKIMQLQQCNSNNNTIMWKWK